MLAERAARSRCDARHDQADTDWRSDSSWEQALFLSPRRVANPLVGGCSWYDPVADCRSPAANRQIASTARCRYSGDLQHGKSPARLPSRLTLAGLIQRAISFFLLLAIAGSRATAETGSSACAQCHAGIFASYMATPMASSSGR